MAPTDLATLLTRCGPALRRARSQSAAAHGLSATELDLLAALAPAAAVSHRDLAARLELSPATLTPALDALERCGAVVRTTDAADRRVRRVALTPVGRELLAVAAAADRDVLDRLPRPASGAEAVIRAYLLAVLAATDPLLTPDAR